MSINPNVILCSIPFLFLQSFIFWKGSESRSVVSKSLPPHGLYSPWSSPGQNAGVGSYSLLQGMFPTGIEPRSPALQADSSPAELQRAGGAKTALLPHLHPLLPQSAQPQRYPCLQELACASASRGNTLQSTLHLAYSYLCVRAQIKSHLFQEPSLTLVMTLTLWTSRVKVLITLCIVTVCLIVCLITEQSRSHFSEPN